MDLLQQCNGVADNLEGCRAAAVVRCHAHVHAHHVEGDRVQFLVILRARIVQTFHVRKQRAPRSAQGREGDEQRRHRAGARAKACARATRL